MIGRLRIKPRKGLQAHLVPGFLSLHMRPRVVAFLCNKNLIYTFQIRGQSHDDRLQFERASSSKGLPYKGVYFDEFVYRSFFLNAIVDSHNGTTDQRSIMPKVYSNPRLLPKKSLYIAPV